jgi:Glu-tRNA(Gln) amidotransferase subunit E-like FAD-binding protein
LRLACFLFGERLVGLRRRGIAVGRIPLEHWCEFFGAVREKPVLFEARDLLVRHMAELPDHSLAQILEKYGFNEDPGNWCASLLQRVAEASQAAYHRNPDLVRRIAMGRLMSALLGRVRACEVAAALLNAMEEMR